MGQYCDTDDPAEIYNGVEKVKSILRDNYVRPDESQKILALMRENESYTIKDLAINGRDLALLGIKEGKKIGELLEEALEYVIENPTLNNKEHLIKRITK